MRRNRAQEREGRDRIGQRGEGAQIYRCDVENGGDLVERRKKRRQESNESVNIDPNNLENRKEVGRKHKVIKA